MRAGVERKDTQPQYQYAIEDMVPNGAPAPTAFNHARSEPLRLACVTGGPPVSCQLSHLPTMVNPQL
jgi:hypothetical protein